MNDELRGIFSVTRHVLLQFWHLDWILARLADAAEQRPSSNNRLVGAARVTVERDDMRHLVDMLSADRAPAEDTSSVRGALAVPAVHCSLLTFCDCALCRYHTTVRRDTYNLARKMPASTSRPSCASCARRADRTRSALATTTAYARTRSLLGAPGRAGAAGM